jgi:hypothetical protein
MHAINRNVDQSIRLNFMKNELDVQYSVFKVYDMSNQN